MGLSTNQLRICHVDSFFAVYLRLAKVYGIVLPTCSMIFHDFPHVFAHGMQLQAISVECS